jgi:hypothetical protein
MNGQKRKTLAKIAVAGSLLIWFASAIFFQDWIWATRLIRALLLGSWGYAAISVAAELK